ncbi:retrovirus-related Pol polyprotein from transposon TNT 1-94 [Trichonephila clavipes]|nr:retrovirus-related Pol polyprotein from transposon TNT 1-94 [Trichonephila clavipes]
MIEKDNVMCGTMVIVKEDFTPVCNWLLGRVVEVYHGSDADEQALQFAAEENAKVLWDKIRATVIGLGEDRKIDAGNELKNIAMRISRISEPVGNYIARARKISTKCHSLLDWACRQGKWSNIPFED